MFLVIIFGPIILIDIVKHPPMRGKHNMYGATTSWKKQLIMALSIFITKVKTTKFSSTG